MTKNYQQSPSPQQETARTEFDRIVTKLADLPPHSLIDSQVFLIMTLTCLIFIFAMQSQNTVENCLLCILLYIFHDRLLEQHPNNRIEDIEHMSAISKNTKVHA